MRIDFFCHSEIACDEKLRTMHAYLAAIPKGPGAKEIAALRGEGR